MVIYNSRITRHQEKLLQKLVSPIVQIKDEEVWNQIVQRFADRMHGGPYYVRIYYLTFLSQVHQFSVMERRRRLAVALVTQYMKEDIRSFYDGTKYTIAIFDIAANSGLFEEYYVLFPPIRHQNDYNIELIALLMEHKMYPLAEKYCLEQIAGNSNVQYDRAYLEFLAEIYTIERFLKQLLYRSDNISPNDEREIARLQPFFEELLKVCLKHYSNDELKLVIKEQLKNNRF